MRARFWGSLLFVCASACSSECKKPAGGADAANEPDSSADAAVDVDVEAGPAPLSDLPPMPELPTMEYAKLCPELEADAADAAPPEPAGARAVVVSARLRMRAAPPGSSEGSPTSVFASIAAPTLRLEHEVFRLENVGDPFECCSEATKSELRVSCDFSGAVELVSRAIARREGDALVVRWCNANASTKTVDDRGEVRTPISSGTSLRFAAASPRCVARGSSPPRRRRRGEGMGEM